MSTDTKAPAPLRKFAWPFAKLVGTSRREGASREVRGPKDYYDALALAEDGFYPIGANGQWHGGIHFGRQTGTILDQDNGIRCIADGEVIAWKVDDTYPTVEYDTCGTAKYSTGFVLVRHRLALPPAPADHDTVDREQVTGSAGAGDVEEPTLLFYSLYIHLLDWQGYRQNPDIPRPHFWGAGAYAVGEGATDADRNRNPHIPHGGIGLNLRDAANAVVGFAPRGTQLRLGGRRGTSGYYAVTEVAGGSIVPPGLTDFYAFRDEMTAVPAEPHTKGSIVIPESPIQIAAGALVGHLGEYKRYIDAGAMCSDDPRPLAQIDLFTTDNIEAFIEASRARAAQLPASSKTLLVIESGAQLAVPAGGGETPSAVQLATARAAGGGPAAGYTRVLPIKALDSVTEEDGTRWWSVDVGTEAGETATGWVRERGHAHVRLASPWEWPGFEIVRIDNTRPDQFYAHRVAQEGNAASDEQGELEQRGAPADSGSLFRKLYDTIDNSRDEKITADEIRRALQKNWLAQALSHLIIDHESEWSGPMAKWDAIDELIPENRKKDWAKEKERIESLLWWDGARGHHGLPKEEPLITRNIHPAALLAQFSCNCACINVEKFVSAYKERHGEFSNSVGQTLDSVSEGYLRTLIQSIVDYYSTRGQQCFIPHIAYMLATARHETLWRGIYFEPRTEGGNVSYFNKYDPILARTQPHRDRAIDMENTQKGDGYTYRGRGYVQLTWKVNYRRCGEHLGIDLVTEPDRALEPEVAAGCMTYGMFSGIFTGTRITRYVNKNSIDYFNARRVINGTDKAQTIADYARLFEQILEESRC